GCQSATGQFGSDFFGQRSTYSAADLRQSNLCEANLSGADLNGIQIEGADFSKARMSEEQRFSLIDRASGTNEITGNATLDTLREAGTTKPRRLFGLL
ncbi:MAG: hypothetical protein HC924_07070, partial [Synechococcaceae cyanobacterium SM2_3_2]|nr:hypothetical protein [Synechococcaceae cyanobacterium SM2_3_2]